MTDKSADMRTHFEVFGREWPQSGDEDVAVVRLLQDFNDIKSENRRYREALKDARFLIGEINKEKVSAANNIVLHAIDNALEGGEK